MPAIWLQSAVPLKVPSVLNVIWYFAWSAGGTTPRNAGVFSVIEVSCQALPVRASALLPPQAARMAVAPMASDGPMDGRPKHRPIRMMSRFEEPSLPGCGSASPASRPLPVRLAYAGSAGSLPSTIRTWCVAPSSASGMDAPGPSRVSPSSHTAATPPLIPCGFSTAIS